MSGDLELDKFDKRELSKQVCWDAIVITVSIPKWQTSIKEECMKWSKAGLFPLNKLLLIIEDPQPSLKSSIHSLGVGSGGATINGLLIVAEKLSALGGYTTINTDVLQNKLILMVHFGRTSHHFVGGHAFIPINCSDSWLPSSLQCPFPPVLLLNSLWMASLLATQSTAGVWLSSVDFFIPFSSRVDIPNTSSVMGALICSLNSETELLKFPHGIITATSEGMIQDITYKNLSEQSEHSFNKELNVISGSTFISSHLAETILSLHTLPPLDRCTYYGTDCDTEPVQISFYFDILYPLYQDANEFCYIMGEPGAHYAQKANYGLTAQLEGKRGRQNIWTQLRGKFVAFEHHLNVDSFFFLHPSMTSALALQPILQTLEEIKPKSSIALYSSENNNHKCKSIVSNVHKKEHSSKIYINNCHLDPESCLEFHGDSILVNLQFFDTIKHVNFGSNLVWQMWPLKDGFSVITSHGFYDDVTQSCEDSNASVFNYSFQEFLSVFCFDYVDIWDDIQCPRNLFNAKLFSPELSLFEQVRILEIITRKESLTSEDNACLINKFRNQKKISFNQIINNYDLGSVLEAQDDLLLELCKMDIKSVSDHLVKSSLLPVFSYVAAISTEATMSLLSHLHKILDQPNSSSSRILAHIADLLGCLGGKEGGLRSGPAANREWAPALLALKRGDHQQGIRALLNVCKIFVASGKPEDIIRASRHYERASQILISKQVETANEEVYPLYRRFDGIKCLPVGVWVTAHCPARLDLAGGWTDTPPVCYEQGGAVLNVAIKVNGKKPIGAKARFITSLKIVCVLQDISGSELKFEWNNLEQLTDYENPVASGALIKAVLIYTDFVNMLTAISLSEQLKTRYDAGLEIIVWSDLPQGSGLGGSSLIAGVILSSLGMLMGYPAPTTHQLIHAVLGIEQMLTTGGGWQDQIGGLVGGIKLGVSTKGVPLVVQTFSIPQSEEFFMSLNTRLLLLYTGKVRLARNLLQTVIRNWYAREENVTRSFSQLRILALRAAHSVLDGNYEMLGDCINQYWILKKTVASGCEPTLVSDVMSELKDEMLGQSLAGAGGGGYLYGISRNPINETGNNVHIRLRKKFPQMPIDSIEIDNEGLTLDVDGQTVMVAQFAKKVLTKSILQDILQSC